MALQVDDDIEGSFDRPKQIDVSMTGREYGPTAGIKPLRVAIANLYNAHHRQGKDSQYTWENVAVVPGGRAGLIRIAAVLNNAYLGSSYILILRGWLLTVVQDSSFQIIPRTMKC